MKNRQPILFWTALSNAALLILCTLLALTDNTQIVGLNRWIKPMKFTASVAIYLATMAWYWPVAVAPERAKRRAAWFLAGTMVFEIVIILAQAARGVRSHFNADTPMDLALFNVMGVVIMINIITAAVVCRWTFRASPTAYIWGVRFGLFLFVIFSLEGIVMARRLAHAVGVPDGGPGLPVLNWSTTGGDLRIAHFLGMHALQVLPLIGFLTGSSPAVTTAFAVWAGLSIAALWHALAGQPLVRL